MTQSSECWVSLSLSLDNAPPACANDESKAPPVTNDEPEAALPIYESSRNGGLGVVISGSPGIGKSIYGLLLIAWLRTLNYAVYYENHAFAPGRFLFVNGKICSSLPADCDAVYVCDPRLSDKPEMSPVYFSIFCSSPRSDRLGDVSKDTCMK